MRGVFRRLIPNLPFAAEIFVLVCIEVSFNLFGNERIEFSFVLQHLLILFCQLIRSSIDNVPYWIRLEKSKMEYRRREALKVKK
jgi:hypothetical protein